MKKLIFLLSAVSFSILSCHSVSDHQLEKWKQEITDTEMAFSNMAEKEGVPAAFLAYSASDGVMMRDNQIIKGHSAMDEYFEASRSNPNKVLLTWAPDFVDVASSGDLGYTYGKYTLTITDTLGKEQQAEGIFHTVWKRQADGSWKFVWD